MSSPPVSAPQDHSQINYINDRIFNIFKVHREHTSYHDFLIIVDSCQIFRTFFRDLFIIVFPGHLHEAHNGNAEKTACHKAKKKLQHNVFLPNAFHDETNKNDKIRTLV